MWTIYWQMKLRRFLRIPRCRYRNATVVWILTILIIYVALIFLTHLNWRVSKEFTKAKTRKVSKVEVGTNTTGSTVIPTTPQVVKAATIKQVTCDVTVHQNFPLCYGKLQYLRLAWRLPCFKDVHGVTDSQCSMLQYLSEVEHFCPVLPHRRGVYLEKQYEQIDETSLKLEPDDLLKELSDPSLQWLRSRVILMWPGWREAGQRLMQQSYIKKRSRKKVLFFLGSMSFQSWILNWAGHGGPLGELIQWTDVISSTYLLGHEIRVIIKAEHLDQVLQHAGPHNCIPPNESKARDHDIIFTDINGMGLIGKTMGLSIQSLLRCKFRLLDSFGTQAEFNSPGYPGAIPGGKSGWGNIEILLGQFMTLFPHTPDNTFLGFVAGTKDKFTNVKRNNRALVYGKLTSYFKGLDEYLDVIHEYFEIHATAVNTGVAIPSYVVNHGSVDGKTINKLIKSSKVFVGLGFPFEGPGPLEAAVHGTPFINPKFKVPRNKLNDGFFAGKPTLRKLTSQSPYMEDFVGEPYVYTIDISNKAELRRVLEEISKRETFEPYLPKEFTQFGLAERVHAFIEHQEFCSSYKPVWPPLKSRQIFVSEKGETCTQLCKKKGLVCEGSYFHSINTRDTFKSLHIDCVNTRPSGWTHAPSFEQSTSTCYLQVLGLSFSCDGQYNSTERLCPCRDYMKEQVAICRDCLL